MDNNLIPIKDYASIHGVTPATIRQRILRGAMPGAVKVGRDWLIPHDLPFVDNRENGLSKRWQSKKFGG